MNVAGTVRRPVNAALRLVGLALVRRATLDSIYGGERSSHIPRPLPDDAVDELRHDNPRLLELKERYRGHPATAASTWSEAHVANEIELSHFRGDNAFVWQRRHQTRELQYGLTTFYAVQHDSHGLLETLTEDGLFGAYTYDIDGKTVSRDLLDSVLELNFLVDRTGLGSESRKVLDIGSGYGRLAYRAVTAFPGLSYVCTDAVAVSTFLSEYYLRFRAADGATVVPLDEIEHAVKSQPFDLAVNIHSFSECPIAAIAWWLDIVTNARIPRLMIVPNTGTDLMSTEPDGSHRDFRAEIEGRGYHLTSRTPKYAQSAFAQQHGVFPSHYFTFELT